MRNIAANEGQKKIILPLKIMQWGDLEENIFFYDSSPMAWLRFQACMRGCGKYQVYR